MSVRSGCGCHSLFLGADHGPHDEPLGPCGEFGAESTYWLTQTASCLDSHCGSEACATLMHELGLQGTSQPTNAPTDSPTMSPTNTPTNHPTIHPCDDGSHTCEREERGG